MFPRSHRIPHKDFVVSFRSGQRYTSPAFTLVIAATKKEEVRYSVVVSKKVFSSAVMRNRWRRRIYSIIKNLPVDVLTNTDIILVMNNSDVSRRKLPILIRDLFNQAGLLKE